MTENKLTDESTKISDLFILVALGVIKPVEATNIAHLLFEIKTR